MAINVEKLIVIETSQAFFFNKKDFYNQSAHLLAELENDFEFNQLIKVTIDAIKNESGITFPPAFKIFITRLLQKYGGSEYRVEDSYIKLVESNVYTYFSRTVLEQVFELLNECVLVDEETVPNMSDFGWVKICHLKLKEVVTNQINFILNSLVYVVLYKMLVSFGGDLDDGHIEL